ncbi:MAG: Na+/H+ antiporter subunit E [Rhizobiales bacterium]|nr:Na+/H+ antiporter subunit E [Hyphomicrobiales bacterium]
MRFVSLTLVLFGFWLLLSGHYTTTLLIFGVLSSVGTAIFARRMGILDSEGHPIHLALRALLYWPWLLVEIVKSSLSVTRIILSPRLAIHPTMLKVRASQKSAVGINIYANSITLTPGTITVGLKGNDLTIHAITGENADDLVEGGMDRKVSDFEGLT